MPDWIAIGETWHWQVVVILLLLAFALYILLERRAVRRRSAELQSLFDNMQEVLYRTDGVGCIAMVTPSITALSGYRPDEVIGRPVTDFYINSTEREELLRMLDINGRVRDYRLRLRHKDGGVLWVSINCHVYRDERKQSTGVEGTIRDISTLKKAEEELQTLALAVENSPAGIIITDREASIVHVNPAFEQISGYSRDEVIGKNPRMQSSGQTPVGTYRDMWQTVSAGETWRGEFLNRRKNGEIYCQASAIAPVRDKHGEIMFYVAVQEDISGRKQAAMALEHARAQAVAADEAKSRFLASASHDLRQPLQAMRLYIDVLVERFAGSPEQTILARLQVAHRDIADLLDRLLDVSRLDTGEVQPREEVFDLAGLLQEIHEHCQVNAEEAGLACRLRVPRNLWVDSDPVLVKEILSNLLSNAIRHTHEGGILLAARRRGEKVRVEVWDTGPGIDEQRQETIFEPFMQLGNPERDRRKGVGLGLSIARRLSRLLGSDIDLMSRPQRGSVFCFHLKGAADGTALPVQSAQAATERDFTGRLIFVVDDDEQLRDSLITLLQHWRCEVMSFEDGQAARNAMQNNRRVPDAVIADYRLRNNATGIEVVTGLREAAGRSIPALLLTGDTDPACMQQASAAGLPLLHKPVAAQKLGLFLERHL